MKIFKSNNIFKRLQNFGTPSNNSKKIKKNGVFFAINGEKENGNIYIKDAIKNGARAIVGDINLDIKNIYEGISYFIVPDVRKCFGITCSNYFSNPSDKIYLCGITGTNGKTSVAYLLASIFEDKNSSVIGTIETKYKKTKIKSTLTTPDTFDLNKILQKINKEKIRNCFLEASSHSLELSRVEGINFNSAIFTNISRDHIDFHKNMDNYYKSKSKLFTYYLNNSTKKNKVAIINVDDKYGRKIIKIINKTIKIISYSTKNTKADYYLKKIERGDEYNIITVKNNDKEFILKTKLFGLYNFQNILASFALCKTKGISIKKIISGIQKFEGAPGRLEKIKNNKFNIFIDYAHTPDALEKSIQSLKENYKNHQLTVLFGCGGNRDIGKRLQMGKIASENAEKVIITSDNPRYENPNLIIKDIVKGVNSKNKNKIQIVPNRSKAIKSALKKITKNTVLLIAGKGHEDYQEINGIKNKFSDKREVKKWLKNLM